MCLSHPKDVALFLVHGKTVFQENSPWCQKGWELLLLEHTQLWTLEIQHEKER